MNPKITAIIVIATIVILLTAGLVLAATYLQSNHIQHPDPLEPAPSPSASPSPSPSTTPTSVTLTANDTTIHLYDKITFTAQLNAPVEGIIITYYNNGTSYDTYTTDATGKATFTRGPFSGAYDCHVTATIPEGKT
jgi:hypothetical protein